MYSGSYPRASRTTTRQYFGSLADLRVYHRRLFEQRPASATRIRHIAHAGVDWAELTVRFPHAYPNKEAVLARELGRFLQKLAQPGAARRERLSRRDPDPELSDRRISRRSNVVVEGMTTANVILEAPVGESYSVWYGQDYATRGSRSRDYILDGPFRLRYVSDLRQFTSFSMPESAIVESFDSVLLPQSGLSVRQVVSLCFLFRSLTPRYDQGVL